MKLIYHIMLRVVISMATILGVWAYIFFSTIVDEVQDETDDVLEDYSALIIQNFLAGESMPSNDNGSNNTYYLNAIAPDSIPAARAREGFSNQNIFISYKNEEEPARILRQIFIDQDDNYFEITVITPTIDQSDLIDAIWQSLVILFALLLIVILITNNLAIKDGLRPLEKFMMWLNRSDIESCTTPDIESSKIKEIEELTKAINSFAQRGKQAFEDQKEFIGNASHELQTPIAVCQNRLELLCESGLNEKQMEDVAGCLSTLSRLSRLNKSLLMLSKIDNGGFESHEVNINEIVKANITFLEEVYQSRNITLTLNEIGICTINANRELASTLVVNLIKNSYSHNFDGGVIHIEIGTDFIVIENSGSKIALNEEKIFSRFYQGRSKSGSYGLGLAITHSICKLYNFKITYSFESARHCFKIKFR
ncbi:MAG: HAMP domain-containing sensor histidine kinase [Rikenellaceae bacterium]